MGWESSGVDGFDLGPLLQGQMRIAKLKSAYNSLAGNTLYVMLEPCPVWGYTTSRHNIILGVLKSDT